MINQIVYWHAPFWEVLLIACFSLALLGWLTLRATRRPTWSDVLSEASPALERVPLFFFSQSEGLQGLNATAQGYVTDVRSSGVFMDTVLESFVEGRMIQGRTGEVDMDVVTTIPLIDVNGRTCGVLALLSNEPLALTDVSMAPPELQTSSDWSPLGSTLWLHAQQPYVKVLRSGDEPDAARSWQERTLSPQENHLLRFLVRASGEVQPSEALFSQLWPEDVVEPPGLSPSQRDRLRRFIYELRQHIEPDPRDPTYLCTAYGVGYVFYCEKKGDGLA